MQLVEYTLLPVTNIKIHVNWAPTKYKSNHASATQESNKNHNSISRTENHETLPHASAILERVRPALQCPPEMGMNLVPLLPALIQKGQFKERPHIRPFAGQGNKQ